MKGASIVCINCHERRPHVARRMCSRCYSNWRYHNVPGAKERAAEAKRRWQEQQMKKRARSWYNSGHVLRQLNSATENRFHEFVVLITVDAKAGREEARRLLERELEKLTTLTNKEVVDDEDMVAV